MRYRGKLRYFRRFSFLAEVIENDMIFAEVAGRFENVWTLTWLGPQRLQPAPSALAAQTPGRHYYLRRRRGKKIAR